MEKNPNLQTVDVLENTMSEMIEQIMSIPDDTLTNENLEMVKGMFRGAFTPAMREKCIKDIIEQFELDNMSKSAAKEFADSIHLSLAELLEAIAPSKEKAQLLTMIFDIFTELTDAAVEQYRNFTLTIPMKIGENGHIPTYAHETDAAADIYSAETITIPAHSISNFVKTEMRFALPEGWVAHIAPRSSIGANTPLRLSNELGIIDSEYRGEVKILFDNISDSDYTINKGDRIAQMWIEPVYKFKPQLVDILGATVRAEGGFGSTGQ